MTELLPSTGDEAADDGAADGGATEAPPRPGLLRNRRILLGVLAGIVVLLIVAIGLAWRFLQQDSISLGTPAAIGNLTLDDSGDAKQTAEYLRTAVAARIALDQSVGAVYKDPVSTSHDVLFFGGTHLMLNPSKDLDQAIIGLLSDSSGEVTGLHEVPAGPLGGVMKCGTSNGDGGAMAVCGWADRGSLGVALFPGRTLDESAELLRTLRGQVEHVS
jgi:hypothetical protein